MHCLRAAGAMLWTAVSLAAAGCGSDSASAESSGRESADSGAVADDGRPARPISLPVAGAEVRRGDLVLTVATTGQVRSEALAALKTEAAGTVLEVLVRPGDAVRRGQALVRLDPRPFDLAVAEAEAAVEQAEVVYRDRIVPDSIVSGEAPSEARRRNALASSGLRAARVRLERAQYERERATITAPFDGVVERVDVAPGERLQPGQAVATVVDVHNLRIEASVLEHDLPLIRKGGAAVATTPAAPDRPLRGTVAAVLPVVDSATRAGRAVVRVRAAQASPLRPGMYADVRLEADRLRDRLIVPAAAIIERDGRPLVFVAKDGRAQWTYVTPGRSNGAETEILPDSSTGVIPLEPGDTVLTAGHLTLTHDAPVKLVAPEESEPAAEASAGAAP